jgi:hypothetical protein
MRGISLMPRGGEAEYGLALAMGIRMERFWLDLGAVLQQTI